MVSLTRVALAQITTQQQRLARTIGAGEAQIASGARLTRASDAPGDWAELSSIARERSGSAAIIAAIATGRARAGEAERVLGRMTEVMTRAQELMVAAGGPTGSGAGSAAIVAELTAIRAELTAATSARSGDGRAIFDGNAADLIPIGGGRTAPVSARGVDVATLTSGQTLDTILADAISAAGAGDAAARGTALNGLTDSIAHLAVEQARQGVRLAALDQADSALRLRDIDLAARESDLGDTDIATTISMVQTHMVQRDAARAILARTTRETLFDLLR